MSAYDPAEMQMVLNILATPGVVGFDFETTVSRLYERKICTIQVAHEDGREAFLWVYGQDGLIRTILKAAERSPATLAAHFAIFETETAMRYGFCIPFKCTYIAARVLRGVVPGNGIDPVFSLAGRVSMELGEERDKSIRSSDWTQPPTPEMIEYALLDARDTRDLWILYDYELHEDPDQLRGFNVVNNALLAIAECNNTGLRFNREAHLLLCSRKQHELETHHLALDLHCDGQIDNHGSPKQVGQWLAEQISFEPGCSALRASLLYAQMTGEPQWRLTASGQLSTDKDYIASILATVEYFWPEVGAYLRARSMYQKTKKLLEAFGPVLETKVDADGNLRGSLIPHGARTSRQSCRDPNLQQMPAEDEMRALFERTSKGRVIVQADYEQVELVVGCVICADQAMQEVFRQRQDIHSATAANIAGIPYAEFDKDDPYHAKLRKGGKPVTFAALYGAQTSTIALNSGLPMLEAEKLLNDWLNAYPGIREYRETEPARAHEVGYTQLVSGQKIAVRKDSRAPQLINIRVQGGAASVMYLAATYVWQALRMSGLDAKMALLVHDEILLDCAEEDAIEAAELLQREMTNAIYDLFPEVRDIKRGWAADAAVVHNWAQKDLRQYKLATLREAA